MTSPEDDLPDPSGWHVSPENSFRLELDLDPDSLQLESDYVDNVRVLRRLGLTGDLPSLDRVDCALESLNLDGIDFLKEHCKEQTLIIVPSAIFEPYEKSSGLCSVGIIAELDLQFEQKTIGTVYSIISRLLNANGLRFLYAQEWSLFCEIKRLLEVTAAPKGTYFPLHSDINFSEQRIPAVSLIGENQKFLTFTHNSPVPPNITYLVAAMVDISL